MIATKEILLPDEPVFFLESNNTAPAITTPTSGPKINSGSEKLFQ